ncbi:MAG: agmatinase [Alphaproteobacteria bacterium]|nr:agmatinase [Alphaproteobacteria bacterium]
MTKTPKLLLPSAAFLGLTKKQSVSYKDARAVIIPFGLETSVSYGGGTAKGPAAMIKASHQVELFDDQLWREPYKDIGIVTLKEPKIATPLPKALDQLEGLVAGVLKDNKFPFVFGGEHSITPGAIRPFAKKYKDLTILQFDAHADLRDGYDGQHYSHAAAMRRCLDHKNVSLVSVGIRNISAEEIPFLEANKKRITIHWARDMKRWNAAQIVKSLKGKNIYLTFDIDGFDASMIPATGTPEPGGMFWNDAIEIITAAAKVSTIVGADVNELAPQKGMHACDFLAAKLAYKILSLALRP